MQFIKPLLIFLFSSFLFSSYKKNKNVDWSDAKNEISVINHLSGEYETPHSLPLNSLAWEDGAFITRDGLDLYCIYIPTDLISFANKSNK